MAAVSVKRSIRGYCEKVRASDTRKETRERRVKKKTPGVFPRDSLYSPLEPQLVDTQ